MNLLVIVFTTKELVIDLKMLDALDEIALNVKDCDKDLTKYCIRIVV